MHLNSKFLTGGANPQSNPMARNVSGVKSAHNRATYLRLRWIHPKEQCQNVVTYMQISLKVSQKLDIPVWHAPSVELHLQSFSKFHTRLNLMQRNQRRQVKEHRMLEMIVNSIISYHIISHRMLTAENCNFCPSSTQIIRHKNTRKYY